MTYRDPVPLMRPCPVCELPGERAPKPRTGWWCPPCRLLFTGTTAEWEQHATHRKQRKLDG